MYRNLALPPPGKGVTWTAIAVFTLFQSLLAVLVVASAASTTGRSNLWLLAVGQVMAAGVVARLLWPVWRRQAAFDGQRLRVRAALFTREAALAEFSLDQARVVDLREEPALRPWLKTWGFGLPGFKAGHYRLRDGRKAFCLLSDPSRALVLPRLDGGLWLLSLQHPQAVLEILRRAAG